LEDGTVSDLTIRPTAKFLKAGTLLAAVIFLALEVACLMSWNEKVAPWIMALPPLVFIWPAVRAVRRRYTVTVISGDRLRYETGLARRSSHNIQLSKIQNVQVDQSLTQRVFHVGNLGIETAGENSRLTLFNVDDPQALADEILNRAQKGTART
jgi:uncharacterized membrane protein YdbT with pleckstrin-like domain